MNGCAGAAQESQLSIGERKIGGGKGSLGKIAKSEGFKLSEAWLSSRRLFAPTGMLIAAPPPLGVRVRAETVTSKEITLSAGASPKRIWALETAGPFTGVGFGNKATEDPPPPHPAAKTSAVTTMTATMALPAGCANVFQVF